MFSVAVISIGTSKELLIERVMHLKYSVLFDLLSNSSWILSQFHTNGSERYRCIQPLLNNNAVILVHMFLIGFYFFRHDSSFCFERDLYKNTYI